ncbi:MAG: hypothetical protein ACOH1R_11025 [Luteimonas sp.]
MSWDPLQREILDTLGHDAYRLVSSDVATAPVAFTVPDDALLRALLRAAGRTTNAVDTAVLCGEWMPTARLRAPSAKRALWPRLRALRASTRPA